MNVTPKWSVMWPESKVEVPWSLEESWVKWIIENDDTAIGLISLDGERWAVYNEKESV